MGVCPAVRDRTLAIDAAFGRDDPPVGSVVQASRPCPAGSAAATRSVGGGGHSVLPNEVQHSLPISLLVAVFEFGRLNLYGAFQPETTSAEFRTLTARLCNLGLVLNDRQSGSEW